MAIEEKVPKHLQCLLDTPPPELTGNGTSKQASNKQGILFLQMQMSFLLQNST